MKRLIKLNSKIYLKDIIDEDSLDEYGYNTDYGNRSAAITYIDGKIYEDEVHTDAIQRYFDELNIDKKAPNGFIDKKYQKEIEVPSGFASLIMGKDGKTYVAIYKETLFNLTVNEFANAITKIYPNAIVCTDDNRGYDNENNYLETI